MIPRSLLIFAALGILFLVSCGTNATSGGTCLAVTPDEPYVLSGTAMTTAFAPNAKTYVVRNTCSEDVRLSVEEDVRWLDVEIDAFGGVDEFGILSAGTSIDVVIEVRYGDDNPQRLDQLAPGTYEAELRFDDDTNDKRVVRSVDLTVNAP